jgi:ATP-dependent Clp protease, protease subunit
MNNKHKSFYALPLSRKRCPEGEGEEEDKEGEGANEGTHEIQFTLPYNLIMLNGDITDKTGKEVSELLLAFDYKNALSGVAQPIHLMINSGGGSVTAAWQICDIMDCIATPVYTIGVGTVASAALAIFINGQRGHRILSDKTSVMSHQYTWGIEGKYKDLVHTQEEFGNIYQRLEKHYTRNTKLSAEFVRKKLLSDDCWLTAEQAKKLQLTDHVIDFRKYSPFVIAIPPKPKKDKKDKKGKKK